MRVCDVGLLDVGLALFAQLVLVAIRVYALVAQQVLLHFLHHFLAVLLSPQHHLAHF
jgi:hypothetical protein